MAEYIDRQDLIKFLDNIQQPKMPITEGFKFITIDEAIKVVSERPTADVIETPKNATNGDMIQNTFPNIPVKIFEDMNTVIFGNAQFDLDWWDAPYKGE